MSIEEQLIQQLKDGFYQAANTEIQEIPSYLTMKKMISILVEKGMIPSVANRLCAKMDISVSQSAIDYYNEDFNELVESFATFLFRMYQELTDDFHQDADEMILDMAPQFKFELNF